MITLVKHSQSPGANKPTCYIRPVISSVRELQSLSGQELSQLRLELLQILLFGRVIGCLTVLRTQIRLIELNYVNR